MNATSNYLNQKTRTLQEAQLIALYNRLDEVANHIRLAQNSADPDKIFESLKRARDYLEKASDMAIDLER